MHFRNVKRKTNAKEPWKQQYKECVILKDTLNSSGGIKDSLEEIICRKVRSLEYTAHAMKICSLASGTL